MPGRQIKANQATETTTPDIIPRLPFPHPLPFPSHPNTPTPHPATPNHFTSLLLPHQPLLPPIRQPLRSLRLPIPLPLLIIHSTLTLPLRTTVPALRLGHLLRGRLEDIRCAAAPDVCRGRGFSARVSGVVVVSMLRSSVPCNVKVYNTRAVCVRVCEAL